MSKSKLALMPTKPVHSGESRVQPTPLWADVALGVFFVAGLAGNIALLVVILL